MAVGLFVITILIVGYTSIAKKLELTMVTAPMIFIAAGFLLSTTDYFSPHEAEIGLHVVAEVALIILLFVDAARTDLAALRRRHVWPVRMLLLGLPLAIALGTISVMLMLPSWPLVAAALVAAVLAPTDAALGQAVVTNPVVPDRVRQALTVESGLNDGLALPVILLFASLTAETLSSDDTNWIVFGAKQLILGPLVGAVAGLVGGRMLILSKDHNLTSEIYEGIGALALAGSAYLGADLIGGNGFVSTFIAGLCFGNVVKGRCKFIYEFTEGEGQILAWASFLMLGLALVPEALEHLNIDSLVLILISLFLVRPAAIWLSLIGTDAQPLTRLFFGWFGPRGLATALFALLILPQLEHDLADFILTLAVNAVWISALLHGLSAVPIADWYATRVTRSGECPETQQVSESAIPLRRRRRTYIRKIANIDPQMREPKER